MVSGVWVTSRHFRPSEWAPMQEVGYAGRGRMRRGGRGGASTTTSPTPTPPSQAATQPPPTPPKKQTTVRL